MSEVITRTTNLRVSITSQLSPMCCEEHHIARKLNWVQLLHDVAASAQSWDIIISMTSAADCGTSNDVLPQLRHPWIPGLMDTQEIMIHILAC